MGEETVDIVEGDVDRVIGLDLKGSLVGGKSELISCFHKFNLFYLVNFTMYLVVNGIKKRLGSS